MLTELTLRAPVLPDELSPAGRAALDRLTPNHGCPPHHAVEAPCTMRVMLERGAALSAVRRELNRLAQPRGARPQIQRLEQVLANIILRGAPRPQLSTRDEDVVAHWHIGVRELKVISPPEHAPFIVHFYRGAREQVVRRETLQTADVDGLLHLLLYPTPRDEADLEPHLPLWLTALYGQHLDQKVPPMQSLVELKRNLHGLLRGGRFADVDAMLAQATWNHLHANFGIALVRLASSARAHLPHWSAAVDHLRESLANRGLPAERLLVGLKDDD